MISWASHPVIHLTLKIGHTPELKGIPVDIVSFEPSIYLIAIIFIFHR